ncbi:hypothetical protein LAT59_04815 [Candidatus Gracilibacteria bacterium]|nr:hypothetical protein [Candidatus Gracilibacteria bacterium]
MSENTKIKLNLQGLQGHKEKEVEHKIISSDEKAISHINFVVSNTTHPPYKVQSISKKVEAKNNDDIVSTTNNEEEGEIKNIGKMSFATITGASKVIKDTKDGNTPEDQEAEKTRSIDDTINGDGNNKKAKKQDEKIEFKNYRSNFKDESDNLLKKIRKFRYTPKTRVGFVLSLIMITSISIGLLMVFFPEKHSLEIYKASILDIYTSDRKTQNDTEDINTLISLDDEENSDDIVDKDDDIGNDTQEIKNGIDKVESELERVRNHLINRYK